MALKGQSNCLGVDVEHLDIILLGTVAVAVILLIIVLVFLSRLRQAYQQTDLNEQMIRFDATLKAMDENAARREQGVSAEFQANRKEMSARLDALGEHVRKLGTEQSRQQEEFRATLDGKMQELREENSRKLDEMRRTVDEQLQTTLEKRISESFKTVSERLEAVQRGLGEMQNLATGVGDLKRVLTNVKSRGTFGETQLSLLIADMLTPDQYIENYDCGHKTGNARVEFGIRIPGADRDVYLPVDAKFPTEDYERLLGAVELGDVEGIDSAAKSLVRSVKRFAKDIADKYINPPSTTDWAILFLPTEGLYAEILRHPGICEELQRQYRVTIAGPTNFQVLLSTFRMGFSQVALQERANEVWDVLGAVKGEFITFEDQISKMAKNLEAASNHVEKLDVRKRAMLRALKSVESVDDVQRKNLLGVE